MESRAQSNRERVRANAPSDKNAKVDQKTRNNIEYYRNLPACEITQRINELHREWDIERVLEVNAASIALSSIIFGTFTNKKWFFLTGAVAGFLLQHGIQGWCPPLPLFRALGYRTRQEIDEEIYALKTIRGDFNTISPNSKPADILASFRN
ncbi:MAG TPA: YgaP-like transmembrane domain [Bacteroidales bacterium]|nr:YgaP-like transmembrane domain [Bacteroidales bacterium]